MKKNANLPLMLLWGDRSYHRSKVCELVGAFIVTSYKANQPK